MAILGLRGTGDFATDERPKSFRELILWREPNGSAPLFALTSKARKEAVSDPEFAWYEEEQAAIRVQVNGTITTTTYTTITIDQVSAQNLKAGDTLLVETAEDAAYTAEVLKVAADPTNTTTLIVTRAYSGTTAAAIPNDTWLTKIGSAYAEGTDQPTAATRNPTKYYNYTQIFKDVYEVTNTTKAINLRTGDPIKNDKIRKMFDHSTAMEFAMLFGKRAELTGSNGKPERTTGGLREKLAEAYSSGNTHCVKLWTTAATISTFLDAVYKVFDFNTKGGGSGNERLVLAGNGYLNSLNKIIQSDSNTQIQFQGTIKLYGMELMKFTLPQGTLYIKTHPLMNQHGLFNNSAFFINPGSIVYRPLRGRDTKFKDNTQGNGEDTTKGQWLTEMGMEFHHLTTMQYQGNFSA